MKGRIRGLARTVPDCCSADRCDKDGCKVSLEGAPPERVVIDMDCEELEIPDDQPRCDYLFIGEQNNTTWVAPIELKSGRVGNVTTVRSQLDGGAKAANEWLAQGISFQFIPILAHGKSIHRDDLKKLRSGKIQFHGKKRGISLIRCGDRLTKAFAP